MSDHVPMMISLQPKYAVLQVIRRWGGGDFVPMVEA